MGVRYTGSGELGWRSEGHRWCNTRVRPEPFQVLCFAGGVLYEEVQRDMEGTRRSFAM